MRTFFFFIEKHIYGRVKIIPYAKYAMVHIFYCLIEEWDSMRLYDMVWDFSAMLWDSNAMLLDFNVMLCYGVCCKIYARPDCSIQYYISLIIDIQRHGI